MLQTNNYFSHIHPADYNPTARPIIHGASLARNTLIHGAICFNVQMLLCTNHDTSDHDQNKALLEGMFAGWVEEWNEWEEAAKDYFNKNTPETKQALHFEICDINFVALGMQAMFSELDILNLPLTPTQRTTWMHITRPTIDGDMFGISLPHARATVLSNASKFFPYNEKAQNPELLNVWDSHKNAEISVRIAHNGSVGCLIDENGKVRKKAEFGYKTKEAFLLEIQNSKQ